VRAFVWVSRASWGVEGVVVQLEYEVREVQPTMSVSFFERISHLRILLYCALLYRPKDKKRENGI
jgi:hypothetical protein